MAATSYSRQSRFVSYTPREVTGYISIELISIGNYERAGLTVQVPIIQPVQRQKKKHKNITHAQTQNTKQTKHKTT